MLANFLKKFTIYFSFCLALFIAECIIKYYFIINKVPAEGFYFFGRFFQIIYTGNQNIAFSLPLPQILIIVIVLIVLIVLSYIWWFNLIKKNLMELIASSFIIFGALSNLIDRLFLGHVIDYISIWIWPVFNLADIMIVAGVTIYILSEFKKKPPLKV